MQDYASWSPPCSPSSSSSGSSRSSPVHAASLVDPSAHSPAIMELIDVKLSRPVIDYIVQCTADTVDHAISRSQGSAAAGHHHPMTRGRHTSTTRRRSPYLAKFASFAATVLSRAEVALPTALVTLVYIHRARPFLNIALEEWALERVFLGALIVASKYANDSTLKNVHWALCTGVFGKRDVGRIEREFLEVLDWELNVKEEDVLRHRDGLMSAVHGDMYQVAVAPVPSSSRSPPSSSSSSTSPSYPPFRHHSRSSSLAVPDLEPSSPTSSLGSLSPPETPDIHVDVSSTGRPHYQSNRPGAAKPSASNNLNDLLRAFPMPGHHHFRIA
ncbi:unnamed protein product [Mycena citricolor]|uniref:Cyclin N-terminal domain-containing protein n=1 Tax=Mycena citricolor TaxID=2018698 RepID=A0AAD2GZ37_9AGAR|nr:unnamed protein product [Mycena citricolor]